MLRLFFPRIEFSGRLSRAAFYRELALSFWWTPIVVGGIAYVVNELSVAAVNGFQVDHARATAVTGFVLTGIGIRNVIAMLGVSRRRARDAGVSVARATLPLRILMGLALATVAITTAGLKDAIMPFVPLATIAVSALVAWQGFALFSIAAQLVLAPSAEDVEVEPVRRSQNPWAGIDPQAEHKAELPGHVGAQFAQAGKWLAALPIAAETFRQSKGTAADRVAAVLAALPADLLNREQTKIVQGALIGYKQSVEARQQDAEEAPAAPVTRNPADSIAVASYHRPRSGRSSIWSGLLRGPWG